MAADFFIGESLVGDGNEVAHIDLIIGSKSGPAGTAFSNALSNQKDGFTTLLAVVAPNLPAKPDTILFNKVTIKGAKQAVQMFGPAQAAVARAVVDSVESGVIPRDKADDYLHPGGRLHPLGSEATTRRSTTTTIRRRRNRSSGPSPRSRRSTMSLLVRRQRSTRSVRSNDEAQGSSLTAQVSTLRTELETSDLSLETCECVSFSCNSTARRIRASSIAWWRLTEARTRS